MKVTILHILSLFFAGFILMLPKPIIQPKFRATNSKAIKKIETITNECKEKQAKVNQELESTIQILQDSEAYVLQCLVPNSLASDSVCARNFVINH
jgi:hypothetical protein